MQIIMFSSNWSHVSYLFKGLKGTPVHNTFRMWKCKNVLDIKKATSVRRELLLAKTFTSTPFADLCYVFDVLWLRRKFEVKWFSMLFKYIAPSFYFRLKKY